MTNELSVAIAYTDRDATSLLTGQSSATPHVAYQRTSSIAWVSAAAKASSTRFLDDSGRSFVSSEETVQAQDRSGDMSNRCARAIRSQSFACSITAEHTRSTHQAFS